MTFFNTLLGDEKQSTFWRHLSRRVVLFDGCCALRRLTRRLLLRPPFDVAHERCASTAARVQVALVARCRGAAVEEAPEDAPQSRCIEFAELAIAHAASGVEAFEDDARGHARGPLVSGLRRHRRRRGRTLRRRSSSWHSVLTRGSHRTARGRRVARRSRTNAFRHLWFGARTASIARDVFVRPFHFIRVSYRQDFRVVLIFRNRSPRGADFVHRC